VNRERAHLIGIAVVTGPVWLVSVINGWVIPAVWCGVAFGLCLYQLHIIRRR
jgi:hypothetical protein